MSAHSECLVVTFAQELWLSISQELLNLDKMPSWCDVIIYKSLENTPVGLIYIQLESTDRPFTRLGLID